MDQPNPMGAETRREYRAWFGFWAQFAVLGFLAVLGAIFAAEGGAPGDYAAGMILALSSVALAFLRLRSALDGAAAAGWSETLFVDDMPNLIAALVVLTVLGLAGLFLAAGAEGSLHNAGVALFAAAGIGVFLNLKRVFDKRDAHG